MVSEAIQTAPPLVLLVSTVRRVDGGCRAIAVHERLFAYQLVAVVIDRTGGKSAGFVKDTGSTLWHYVDGERRVELERDEIWRFVERTSAILVYASAAALI